MREDKYEGLRSSLRPELSADDLRRPRWFLAWADAWL